MTTYYLCGEISCDAAPDCSDSYDVAMIDRTPIAMLVHAFQGMQVNVVSAKTGDPVIIDDLAMIAADTAMRLEGEADGEYYHSYSEYTGYLWTTSNGAVGGHNLCDEFDGYHQPYGAILISTEPIDLYNLDAMNPIDYAKEWSESHDTSH